MSLKDNSNIVDKLVQNRTDKIIKRTIQEKDNETQVDDSKIRQSIDKKPFYGYVGNRKEMSLALDITTNQGDFIGLQYHLIGSIIRFNISGTISFNADGQEIKIEGRNLRPVYEYLLEHRLVWIAGKTSDLEEFPEDATVIDSITVTLLRELEEDN
jgi:hypothetical protein